MAQSKKRFTRILLALIMLAVCIPALGKRAEAATTKYSFTSYVYGKKSKDSFTFTNWDGYKKFTVSSSNKKVIQVKKLSSSKYRVTYKKAGKAKLTLKYYETDTKTPTYTYVYSIRLYKWVNPFKTFKVGGKNITSKYNYSTYYYKDMSGKVSVKLKSGWKIKKITHYVYTKNEYGDYHTAKPAVKSFKNITMAAGDELYIELKKGSRTVSLWLN